MERTRFRWREFHVENLLPTGWQESILQVARAQSKAKVIVPTSVTSREASRSLQIPVLTVGGVQTRQQLPWLFDLYRGLFRTLGQLTVSEPISIATDDRYAVNLNVQIGEGMRYECHVDSNPLEGLLYVTSHPPGSGGELVVANSCSAMGVEEVSADCERLHPISGTLVFFDGRKHPHYVAPLNSRSAIRVVVAMNYYTSSCPESARPLDLNRHLGLA